MRRSIATVSLSGTLPEKLEAAAAARFDAVEIFENDLLFFDGSAKEARLLADDRGVEICLFQPFRDFEGVSDDLFLRSLDRIERKFDVMQELGAPLLLICSNVAQSTIDDDERMAAQLRQAAERAAKRGLRIGYEALAWGARVSTFGHAWRLVEKAAHPHLGLIVDSFHTLAIKDDFQPIANLKGDRIFFVQLADAPKVSMDPLSWSRHFRCFPGQGDLDVPGFLAAVLQSGYSGPISLEIFNDDFRAAPTRQTASDGMRSLLFVEEKTRARLAGEAPAKTEPDSAGKPRKTHAQLFDPPPVPAFSGTDFVEFTADADTKLTLGELLEELGFARAGQHRSKEVVLYQQGGINLVVNAERDSFAHSYFLMHGPSVCAIGLGTEDDIQAVSRAEAFGAKRYEGRVGPNELHIPAIRAQDAGLLYFVADEGTPAHALDQDFILEKSAKAPTSDAGLIRIDHIAQALPEGQLDSWILFYRSVLGLEPEAPFELPDPYGLVHSRAVASANRTLRFPLNVSQSRNTATARSVSALAGAGVHHVAFESVDIFMTVNKLRRNGLKLLAIPSNYYDDLAARFPLADDFVDKLRLNDLLYDKVGEGELLQAYTEPFQDRFYFEVLQRKGGYDLYGAPNAPVRMAALAQLRRRQPIAS
ncbi:MAG: sugar phosphate isomerase/epimerase and 4-hydroxyphenylpyruvate domain-containing protein [Hyphomicrobiales bacterium]|nr:sugar phosphate isomerase/epimerase and 4-hydroxyphenylpyruvate domain-containing protein [Hyphomicrobiales bacterium]